MEPIPVATCQVRVLATGTDGKPHWGPGKTVAAVNGWGVNPAGCLFLTLGGDGGMVAVYAPHAWFAIELVKEE